MANGLKQGHIHVRTLLNIELWTLDDCSMFNVHYKGKHKTMTIKHRTLNIKPWISNIEQWTLDAKHGSTGQDICTVNSRCPTEMFSSVSISNRSNGAGDLHSWCQTQRNKMSSDSDQIWQLVFLKSVSNPKEEKRCCVILTRLVNLPDFGTKTSAESPKKLVPSDSD